MPTPTPKDAGKGLFARLTIPTHPEFDFDRDSGTIDYVPPVKLNNLLVLYTNAAIELTASVVTQTRLIERLKLEQRAVQRKRDGLRNQLLSENPAPPSQAKNLQLTEAYVTLLAKNAARLPDLERWDTEIAKSEDQIDAAKAEVGNLKYTMETIKLAVESIKTHLAFVKQEARIGGMHG